MTVVSLLRSTHHIVTNIVLAFDQLAETGSQEWAWCGRYSFGWLIEQGVVILTERESCGLDRDLEEHNP
jgi:hypothetical protein